MEQLLVELAMEQIGVEPKRMFLTLMSPMTRCMVNRWRILQRLRSTCYAPVFIFVGGIWRLNCGIECRPSRRFTGTATVIGQIRQQWKSVEIVVRGDSATAETT